MNTILKGYTFIWLGTMRKEKNEEDTFYWSILLT